MDERPTGADFSQPSGSSQSPAVVPPNAVVGESGPSRKLAGRRGGGKREGVYTEPNDRSVVRGWQSRPVHAVGGDVPTSDDERAEGFL